MSLRSVVPALLLISLSFLGISTAQAQAARQNLIYPDISIHPDQAGPGAYSISFNSGPVKDPASGNYRVLVGQQCQAQINLPPLVYGTTVACQWTVSGKTVQANSWTVSSGDTSATFSGLVNSYTYSSQAVNPATTAGPTWYWDDSTTSQTVTCVATITPPSGQGTPSTKTVTQAVTLDIPTYTPGSSVGTVLLDSSYAGNPGNLALHAGGGADGVPGITFKDTVGVPAFYTSPGSWYHLQLITVSRYETPLGSTTAIGASGNSVKGALDAGPEDPGGVTYVYGGAFSADGTTQSLDNDSPGFLVHDTYQEYNVKSESFQDYVMYQAPGTNGISVPLKSLTWSWNVDVKSTGTPKSWANWKGAPTNGTITPPGTPTQTLIYPTWTALRNLAWASN